MARSRTEIAELTSPGTARVVSEDRLLNITAVAVACGRRVVDVSGRVFSVINTSQTWLIRPGFRAIEIVDDVNQPKP